ncbi:MAG: uracil phosphoribosyltransferase [Planctomycetota bacterium]
MSSFLEHGYGDRVHLLDDVHLATLLARVSSPAVDHAALPALVRDVYATLLDCAFSLALPRTTVRVPTRMVEQQPAAGIWEGEVLDPATRVVVVDVVRGGIIPSQVAFERLTRVLTPGNVRLDHLTMSRLADDQGRVSGVDLNGSKVGGSSEGAVLLIPDPMGATGATTLRVIDHYRENFGAPSAVLLVPMIATPEYLARIQGVEGALVVCGRLDRGLSSADVLATPPGTHWERERGLDEHGYIVPGAGGVGEVLNNAWC